MTFTTKFTLKDDGKISFEVRNEAADKEETLEDVQNLDEVIHKMLKSSGITIFDIIAMFKEGLAMSVLGKGKEADIVIRSLKLLNVSYLVGDGDTIGDVLALHTKETVDVLLEYYFGYFKSEFTEAYYKHIGI